MKKQMKRFTHPSFLLLFAVLVALPAASAGQAVRRPGAPCCVITGFTPVDGVVAAREAATGRTFQFKVNDAMLLRSLKVGQKIYANFATKKVSLDGGTPCCSFTPVDGFGPVDGVRGSEQQPAEAGSGPVNGVQRKVNPGSPCCAITGFTPVDGVVAARETATGRTFQFKVSDPALLKTLKVGQRVYANFATKKVSIDGLVPCCNFTPVDGFAPVDGVRGTEQPPTGAGYIPVDGIKPKVNRGVPCCSITGFTPVDGVVAARETATGRTFQFKVNDSALLKTLKVGQKIYANFATKKISVDGAAPCCNMK